jgi:Arc/MetJ-type ribon-helix-helix transcriptional regulator
MVTIAKLPKETEAEIQRLIDSGDYTDGTAVVVRAVHRLVAEQDQVERLRAQLLEGLDDLDNGQFDEWTPELQRQIREEARALAASGAPLDPDVCG